MTDLDNCVVPISNKTNFYIFLHETPPHLTNKTVFQNYKRHILNTAANGREIYELIIENSIEHINVTNYEDSIPLASSLFNEFQRQHKKFNYYVALTHFTKQQDPKEKLKWKYEVTFKSLGSFVDLILYKVVPLQLFGKVNNRRKVKKAALQLLGTCDPLNLQELIQKLDISRIPWVMLVKNEEMRYLVVLKFLSWFFEGFLLKILYAHLHVTSMPPRNFERIYIRRSDWNSYLKNFIKKKERIGLFQPEVQLDKLTLTPGVYKISLKPDGVRLILKPRYKLEELENMRIVVTFLTQLIEGHYHSLRLSFYDQWKLVLEERRTSENKNMHLIACDVSNAFDSIIQARLYHIIRSLCEDLPTELKLQWYIFETGLDNYYKPIKAAPYFCHEKLPLPYQNSTIWDDEEYEKSEWIEKDWLLKEIWTSIFGQMADVGNKIVAIGRGVPQGTLVSPILSRIYYTFVFHKEMATFMNSGFLMRHADDILYVTTSNQSAKQFHQVIRKGLPGYNCSFNSSKTQSNMVYDQSTSVSSVTYGGYNIDCNTLEVTPPDVDLKSCVSNYSKWKNVPLLISLGKWLCNISCFKLTEIVLDETINSGHTINEILYKFGLLQARRAAICIKKLFPNVGKDAGNIAYMINDNNKKIASRIVQIILRTRSMSDGEQCRWKLKVYGILWNSYKRVFEKNKILSEAILQYI